MPRCTTPPGSLGAQRFVLRIRGETAKTHLSEGSRWVLNLEALQPYQNGDFVFFFITLFSSTRVIRRVMKPVMIATASRG
jgi:hypothetical protein